MSRERARCAPDRTVNRAPTPLADTRAHRLTCVPTGQRARTRNLLAVARGRLAGGTQLRAEQLADLGPLERLGGDAGIGLRTPLVSSGRCFSIPASHVWSLSVTAFHGCFLDRPGWARPSPATAAAGNRPAGTSASHTTTCRHCRTPRPLRCRHKRSTRLGHRPHELQNRRPWLPVGPARQLISHPRPSLIGATGPQPLAPGDHLPGDVIVLPQ
jgi:hypothetical protein